MANIAHLRHSKRLLQRAAYWAVTCSWIDGNDFEQGQQDSTDLQALEDLLDELCSDCAGGAYVTVWLDKQIQQVNESISERGGRS